MTKSSRLPIEARKLRRSLIMGKRVGYREGQYIETGKSYPHSSKRQRARYARQIAAGQI